MFGSGSPCTANAAVWATEFRKPRHGRHAGRGNVRRKYDVVQTAERMTGGNRLGVGNVQPGAVQLPVLQGLDQRRRIDQIAPRHVNQQRSRLETLAAARR